MTKKIYIIAHTWQDTDLTIEVFHTPHKAVKKLGALVDDGFEKPNADDDPQEYLQRYNDWISEENDNECDAVIALEVFEV